MAEMIGTGRMNETGGAGTLTIPQEVRQKYGITKGNGIDVVYFIDDQDRLFIRKRSEVEL
jgi:bifunctional DNA-binding transcriptional regulator/antitoxin component of YhaV-PrlF toxin-antitoxin module